ncbi:MAG: hypothetical protein M1419_07785 [Bacteroidetes bacterium]|nr:hypothetical protein [Bacteroidota bacterium]
MLKSIVIILFLFSMAQFSFCQIFTDTVRGEVGDEVFININVPDSISSIGINSMSGKFLISNSTVFYPDSISNVSNYSLMKDSIFNNFDTVWYFNIEFYNIIDSTADIIFRLNGEALAGTDSVCILKFRNVKLNDIDINDFDAVVITHTSGTPLPYIRFAKLDKNYPNPVPGGSSTKWHYIIDKPSIVEFYILDYRAKETFLINLGEQSTGIHEYVFTPDMGFSSGLYWMKLRTNTGESVVPFIIAK